MRRRVSTTGLPFVTDLGFGKGRNWWNVTPSGGYAADCELGTAFAAAYLEYEAAGYLGGALQLIVQSMPRDQSGVEIGFLATVARAAAEGFAMRRAADLVGRLPARAARPAAGEKVAA